MAPQEYEDLVRRLTALVVKLDERVAYLLAADNVSRPLLCRLREVNQPVLSAPGRFLTPRAILLTTLWAYASPSTPRSANRRHVLDRLRLGPRRHPVEQHLFERPHMP